MNKFRLVGPTFYDRLSKMLKEWEGLVVKMTDGKVAKLTKGNEQSILEIPTGGASGGGPSGSRAFTISKVSGADYSVKAGAINGVMVDADFSGTAAGTVYFYAQGNFDSLADEVPSSVAIFATSTYSDVFAVTDLSPRIYLGKFTPGGTPEIFQNTDGNQTVARSARVPSFHAYTFGYISEGTDSRTLGVTLGNVRPVHIDGPLNDDTEVEVTIPTFNISSIPNDSIWSFGVTVTCSYEFIEFGDIGGVNVLSKTTISAVDVNAASTDSLWNVDQAGPMQFLAVGDLQPKFDECCPRTTTEPLGPFYQVVPWPTAPTVYDSVWRLFDIQLSGGAERKLTIIPRHVGDIHVNAMPQLSPFYGLLLGT